MYLEYSDAFPSFTVSCCQLFHCEHSMPYLLTSTWCPECGQLFLEGVSCCNCGELWGQYRPRIQRTLAGKIGFSVVAQMVEFSGKLEII